MGEAADRAAQWRKDKKDAGYKPWLLWVPQAFPARVELVALQHHQTLVDCLMTAIESYANEGRKTVPVSTRDKEDIARIMLQMHQDTLPPTLGIPRVEIEKQGVQENLPELMSTCGNCGEEYPRRLKRCPKPPCRKMGLNRAKAKKNMMAI